MFEPSGMLYELGPSEVMFARLDDPDSEGRTRFARGGKVVNTAKT
ncbi:hypothetical protein ACWGDX_27525 [Streptomyces sp. NPDC055025]